MSPDTSFAALVKSRRVTLGLSQTALADLVGRSSSAVRSWERGSSAPTDESVVQTLAAVLGLDEAILRTSVGLHAEVTSENLVSSGDEASSFFGDETDTRPDEPTVDDEAESERTEEEIHIWAQYEQRRQRKNDRSRERALEKKEEIDRILVKTDKRRSKIEKQFGRGSIMRLGAEGVEDISVIPSGSIGLDIALGVGGFPRGRVIEIYGPESSGKTTLALNAVAQAQKAGGAAAFIDVARIGCFVCRKTWRQYERAPDQSARHR